MMGFIEEMRQRPYRTMAGLKRHLIFQPARGPPTLSGPPRPMQRCQPSVKTYAAAVVHLNRRNPFARTAILAAAGTYGSVS
jgi:hypothetical protein